MSPERPGSAQEETSATPKMSVPGSPVAGTPIRDAQSPISILLAVAQSQSGKVGDDDLTSLAWLHERDLLKGMNINPSPSNSTNSTPIKNGLHLLSDQSPTSDYVDDSSISAPESSNSSVSSPTPANNSYPNIAQYPQSNQRLKHPHNIPYDPLIHTSNKPPYSFSCLIFMAIEDSRQKALPVKEIYAWILEHFPYFKNAPTGWKNSVRHNLSLNKCFQKVEKAPNLGKGSLWTVDPQYKPNLIQALNRSPFHPCSALDPASLYASSPAQSATVEKSNSHRVPSLPNPDLFPFLSKKLAASEMSYRNVTESPRTNNNNNNVNMTTIKRENDESLDAADAAAVMLSLKNCARFNPKEKFVFQIITTSPSQDHTYSAAENGDNGDEAFESDEDRLPKSRTCRKLDFEDDEERKIKEGAETLLNLAGISSRKRVYSLSENVCVQKKSRNLEEEDEEEDTPIGTEDIDSDVAKHTPFKPRLLRTKNRATLSPRVSAKNDDEWVRHRRELEINQPR